MRAQMAARLVEEDGTPKAAAAVWVLARENEWYREGEGAERFLQAQSGVAQAPITKAALDLLVAWHGELLGRLTHDRLEWRWKPGRRAGPALVRETTPGKLPAFIEALLPEAWLAQILQERDEREALQRGRRHFSNIIIVQGREERATPSAEILTTTLAG